MVEFEDGCSTADESSSESFTTETSEFSDGEDIDDNFHIGLITTDVQDEEETRFIEKEIISLMRSKLNDREFI